MSRSGRWFSGCAFKVHHWQNWPIAIWPDTRYGRNGVWHGNMVIDDQGIPTVLYTGAGDGRAETCGRLGRSRDGMVTWE